MTTNETSLRGLSVADLAGGITTYDQLGGTGIVINKALAIPGHLGGPWRSIEYVQVAPAASGVISSVGMHTQAIDELYYIHKGAGILTTNSESQPVSAGCLAIAPTGTRHSIRNESPKEPLCFLVIELAPRENSPPSPPMEFARLDSLMEETYEGFHPATIGQHQLALRLAEIPLRDYGSAPWERLALVEVPAGGRVSPYTEAEHDELLFVVQGNVTMEVEDIRCDSWEDGLSIVVPRGLFRRITNRSSVSPLVFLSVLVQHEGSRQ